MVDFIEILLLYSKYKTPFRGSFVPVLGVKPKRGWYVFWLFFNIDQCSATSLESSRRDLLNDMAERLPIWKKKGRTIPVLVSHTHKTALAFPKTGFCFYCEFMFAGCVTDSCELCV